MAFLRYIRSSVSLVYNLTLNETHISRRVRSPRKWSLDYKSPQNMILNKLHQNGWGEDPSILVATHHPQEGIMKIHDPKGKVRPIYCQFLATSKRNARRVEIPSFLKDGHNCKPFSRWWFQRFFIFTPLGKIPILTNIFQMGWNHQPVFWSLKVRKFSRQVGNMCFSIFFRILTSEILINQ